MKFGVREICDVVLRAKAKMTVGSKTFYKNEPVLYFDSLTTSSLEGAATTSYANGGRGNARLLAWEGERTLTFNFTDALISPESFAVLSGANVIDAKDQPMYVHTTSRAVVQTSGSGDNAIAYIDVPGLASWSHLGEVSTSEKTIPGSKAAPVQIGKDLYNAGADIFIMSVSGNEMSEPAIPYDKGVKVYKFSGKTGEESLAQGKEFTRIECYAYPVGTTVLVDYYVKQSAGKQIEITPDKFGGYFYLEASTLFRDEDTGNDLPAEFVIPRCKVQSNFTFTMAATGDPSTFDFVLDAFPDYSKFDTTKKVLAILQVIEDVEDEVDEQRAHGEKTIKTVSETSEHKSQYAAGGAKYAYTDDMIASTTFRTNDREEG